MKQKRLLSTTFLIATAAVAIAQPAPESAPSPGLQRAQVTIPYEELRALLEAAEQARREAEKKALPPVASAVLSARYTIDFAVGAGGSAVFEVAILSDAWQVIPLLDARVPVTKVEPADATLVARDGMLALVTNRPGSMTVRIEFAPGTVDGSQDTLRLAATPATSSQLVLANVPANRRPVVDGAASPVRDGIYQLPSSGGETAVRLVEEKPEVATTWQAESRLFARGESGQILIDARVRLRADDDGSGLSAKLILPRAARVETVEGADLAGWTEQTIDRESRALDLRWKTADIADRELQLRYAAPLPVTTEAWTITPPRLAGPAANSALIAVAAPDGVRLTPVAGQKALPPTRLPGWILDAAGSAELVVIESPGAAAVELAAAELPRMQAAGATIPLARFESKLVADGALLCEASLRVEHREPMRWQFRLPGGSVLLSCEVGGRQASPLVREDGSLELSLPAPADGAKPGTELRFSYTAQTGKLAPVQGELTLALPTTPLFINDLVWALELPDAYEATALEGNVEIREGGAPGKPVILGKRLCRDEQPQAALFYRKRDLNP